MIRSRTTRQFREAYTNLPEEVRRQARQAYLLFQQNPRHPGLRFKQIDDQSNTWSVRGGLGYRAVGVMDGSVIVWFWIVSHAEYDRM